MGLRVCAELAAIASGINLHRCGLFGLALNFSQRIFCDAAEAHVGAHDTVLVLMRASFCAFISLVAAGTRTTIILHTSACSRGSDMGFCNVAGEASCCSSA